MIIKLLRDYAKPIFENISNFPRQNLLSLRNVISFTSSKYSLYIFVEAIPIPGKRRDADLLTSLRLSGKTQLLIYIIFYGVR